MRRYKCHWFEAKKRERVEKVWSGPPEIVLHADDVVLPDILTLLDLYQFNGEETGVAETVVHLSMHANDAIRRISSSFLLTLERGGEYQ